MPESLFGKPRAGGEGFGSRSVSLKRLALNDDVYGLDRDAYVTQCGEDGHTSLVLFLSTLGSALCFFRQTAWLNASSFC